MKKKALFAYADEAGHRFRFEADDFSD